MRKNKYSIVSILLIILSIASIGINAYAHSGRTGANGGHRDNKNKSGLGGYHYHCGGYPAHLHTNGVCPYSSNSLENDRNESTLPSNNSNSFNNIDTSSSSSSNKENTKSENNNTIKTFTSSNNNTVNNMVKDQETSNPLSGILTLGVLGGGGYWGYKKYKNKIR